MSTDRAITKVSLMRHGHVYNPTAVYYGRLPNFRLSETGQAEAQHTAVALQSNGFAPIRAVFSSPLLRARQTAQIVHEQLQLEGEVMVSDLLLEIHSPYDGEKLTAMEARNWNFYADVQPPYEQPEDILGRVQQFMRQMATDYAGEHVLAVTHGDIITFALMWAMGLPLQHEQKVEMAQHGLTDAYVGTASVTTFAVSDLSWQTRPWFRYTNPNAD